MHLLVEGLTHAPGLKAVIAGRGEEEQALRALITERGLKDRVTLVGAIDDQAKLDYLARCAAVVFTPENEDYGFVTLEAMNSGKGVITVTDSGGPAEIVVDGKNGFVAGPNGASVGAALKRLVDSPRLAQELGAEALKTARAHTWEQAVSKLVL
jgi:glycosyltransferase involved in cell wall biosynthesis